MTAGRCDYAACSHPPVTTMDGWDFCRQHVAEHLADMHGQPWPKLATVSQWDLIGRQPCGTAAAYRRHRRHGEEPCTACRDADRRRKQPENPNGYRGSWYRPWAS